jgi:hypothetical protein
MKPLKLWDSYVTVEKKTIPVTEKNEMDIGFKKRNGETVFLLWETRPNILFTLRNL